MRRLLFTIFVCLAVALSYNYILGLSVQDDPEVANIVQYTIDENFNLEDGHIQEYRFNDIDFLSENEFLTIAEDRYTHVMIWQEICKTIDTKHLAMVTSFEITTDGIDGILASVYLYNIRNNDWRISVDVMDHISDETIRRQYFAETLIHEYGHLISLNRTQMISNSLNCDTFITDEGCTKEDAYMNQYFQIFWKDIYDQINDHDFYDKRRKAFINDYAASNPVEDFAETFVYFVLSDYPKDDSILSEKVKFFYKYNEMKDIRDHLRELYKNEFELQ